MPGMAALTAAVITRVLLVGLSAQTLPSPTSALPESPPHQTDALEDALKGRSRQGDLSRVQSAAPVRSTSAAITARHRSAFWVITRFSCNARSHLRGSDKADHRNGDGAGLQHQSHRSRQIHRTPDHCSTEVAGHTRVVALM